MEMWCTDDTRQDSSDWVGPPAWVRACFKSPEWGGGSSPVKTRRQPAKQELDHLGSAAAAELPQFSPVVAQRRA